MIEVERESREVFDTCNSCGGVGETFIVTVTRVFNEDQSCGTSLHLCRPCLGDLADIAKYKINDEG